MLYWSVWYIIKHLLVNRGVGNFLGRVSSTTQKGTNETIRALALGAVDFVSKAGPGRL